MFLFRYILIIAFTENVVDFINIFTVNNDSYIFEITTFKLFVFVVLHLSIHHSLLQPGPLLKYCLIYQELFFSLTESSNFRHKRAFYRLFVACQLIKHYLLLYYHYSIIILLLLSHCCCYYCFN